MKDKLIREIEFCLELWDKQGHCTFGGHTKCSECAAPYLIYKLITGEALHGDIERLTIMEWKAKLRKLKGKI